MKELTYLKPEYTLQNPQEFVSRVVENTKNLNVEIGPDHIIDQNEDSPEVKTVIRLIEMVNDPLESLCNPEGEDCYDRATVWLSKMGISIHLLGAIEIGPVACHDAISRYQKTFTPAQIDNALKISEIIDKKRGKPKNNILIFPTKIPPEQTQSE